MESKRSVLNKHFFLQCHFLVFSESIIRCLSKVFRVSQSCVNSGVQYQQSSFGTILMSTGTCLTFTCPPLVRQGRSVQGRCSVPGRPLGLTRISRRKLTGRVVLNRKVKWDDCSKSVIVSGWSPSYTWVHVYSSMPTFIRRLQIPLQTRPLSLNY